MTENSDPAYQEQLDDYFQNLTAMHEWYQQALQDAAASSASHIWNRPIRYNNKRRCTFRLRLPVLLKSTPIFAGVALIRVLHTRKAKPILDNVIDLYSEDQIIWKPSQRR